MGLFQGWSSVASGSRDRFVEKCAMTAADGEQLDPFVEDLRVDYACGD